MPRRNQSPFDDLVEIAAKFPWWAGVALAIVAYFVLHYFATMEVAASSNIKDIGVSVSRQIFKTLAAVGQYLLPTAFLLGALISAFSRIKIRQRSGKAAQTMDLRGARQPPETARAEGHDLYELYKSVSVSTPPRADQLSIELLRAIDWKRFEEACAEYFRVCGFNAVTQTHGPDGGIDIRLSAPDSPSKVERIVQCKQWARAVGPKHLRELLGVMTANKVSRGVFVTASTFNDEAIRFASVNQIDLIDGKSLLQQIVERPPTEQDRVLKVATEGDYLTPTCPSCGIKLVKRESRKDNSAFWGCINFPQCRFTLNA